MFCSDAVEAASGSTETAAASSRRSLLWLGDEATANRDLRVGSVVREAREMAGIGVRELARRSGVEPSRISRIERNQTAKPDRQVLTQLAHGLGLLPAGLHHLAGHPVDTAELAATNDDLFDRFLTFAGEDAEDPSDLSVRKFARLSFLHVDPLGALTENVEDAEAIREIVGSWAALTQPRRDLVRAFVADQIALSDLDRRGQKAASYEMSITFRDETGA